MDEDIYHPLKEKLGNLLEGRKPYFRVHILSTFKHACSRAQPLSRPVTVSVAGGEFIRSIANI